MKKSTANEGIMVETKSKEGKTLSKELEDISFQCNLQGLPLNSGCQVGKSINGDTGIADHVPGAMEANLSVQVPDHIAAAIKE